LNPRFRTGILILFVGVVLVGFGIFALSRMISQTLAPLPAPTAMPPITEKVVVMARDVPMGYALAESDLLTLEIVVEMVPRNAIKDIQDAIGKMTKTTLVAGEMLQTHHVVDPTNISHDKAFMIEEDYVLVAFPAMDLMSTLDILQVGDQVEILATLAQEITYITTNAAGEPEERSITRMYTFDAMQKIQLEAIIVDIKYTEENAPVTVTGTTGEQVTLPTATPSPNQITVQAYLIALPIQDALVLKNLVDSGAVFDIALRNPRSDVVFDTVPVSLEYLNDRYNLPLEVERER